VEGTLARADGPEWVVNVTVHGVGAPGRPLDVAEARTWVTVAQLEGVLDAAVGRPDVVVTFDDGNLSDLQIALPRLLERGLAARFFVPAGLLGGQGRLDDADVRELHRAGMTIGAHGWEHRDWRTLAWGRAGAVEVEREMVRARRHLTQVTGVVVSEMATPYGSYDRHVLHALWLAGATRVYTNDGGWARSGSWLQPRTSIRADDGPGWSARVMGTRPSLARRARGRVVGTAKRLRG
jgi:peptidoglycan/xylan/chitin deacetylase (PgdA/CDA1 family)